MNSEALLNLISDLYQQIMVLRVREAELLQQLEVKEPS